MSSSDIDRKCAGNNRHTKTERSIQTPAHESIEFITKEGVKKKHAPGMRVYNVVQVDGQISWLDEIPYRVDLISLKYTQDLF
jgi:hypothetical protein